MWSRWSDSPSAPVVETILGWRALPAVGRADTERIVVRRVAVRLRVGISTEVVDKA
jgi:hypothetical protein